MFMARNQSDRQRKASVYGKSPRKPSVLATKGVADNKLPSNARYQILLPRAEVFCSPPSRSHRDDHGCQLGVCDFVTINVSGLHFRICLKVLEKHPTTLLGSPHSRLKYWDNKRQEFFFDRHRASFEAIFAYYNEGRRMDLCETVDDDIFLEEMEFYKMEDDEIDLYKQKKWMVYSKDKENEEMLQYVKDAKIHCGGYNLFRWVWLMLMYPRVNTTAYMMNVFSVLVTMTAIVLLCVETLDVYAGSHCLPGDIPNYLDTFFLIESTCTGWFTFELICKVIGPPHWKHVFIFHNAVDFLAIVPFYIVFLNVAISNSCKAAKSSAVMGSLRVFRLVSVIKLTHHSRAFQLVVSTCVASWEVLCLFVMTIGILVIFFGSLMYFAELDKSNEFTSLFDGFWWAIVTLTTVGYGDLVPTSILGKVIAAAATVSGVVTLSMPIPILTENFNHFYKQYRQDKVSRKEAEDDA